MKTTDETEISCINALAHVLSESYGSIASTDALENILLEIVGSPNGDVEIYSPTNSVIKSRALPNIGTGSTKYRIRIEKENGCVRWLRFPSTVEKLDRQLDKLRESKTTQEIDYDEFESWLENQLDGYGHLSYTVGSESWLACADAVSCEFNGKRYLAHHVVVDCEYGGFTDTIESKVTEITGDPPSGIMETYLDSAFENLHAHDDEEDEIDVESCRDSIILFDSHVANLWKNPEHDLEYYREET